VSYADTDIAMPVSLRLQ